MLALLLLLACGGEPAPDVQETVPVPHAINPADTPPEATIVEEQGPPPLPTAALTDAERNEMRACTTSSDCIAINIDCCDLCNGGTAMPLNKAHAEQAVAKLLTPKDCSSASCGDVPCDLPPTICHEGKCAFSMAVNKPPPLPTAAP